MTFSAGYKWNAYDTSVCRFTFAAFCNDSNDVFMWSCTLIASVDDGVVSPDNINANCTVSYKCIGDDTHTHTTLFAIKGSNNKNKQTKQSKRSEINHCKISTIGYRTINCRILYSFILRVYLTRKVTLLLQKYAQFNCSYNFPNLFVKESEKVN